MKRTTKIVSLVLAMLMVVALFAGCGGGTTTDQPQQGGEQPANTPASVTVNPEDTTAQQTGQHEVTEETKYADELTYASGDLVVVNPLNPAFVASSATVVMPMLYDTLLQRLPEGGYGPRLATEWSHSDDFVDWTFKLRDDVTFHNGEKFTAQDVADTVALCVGSPGSIGGIQWSAVDNVEVVSDTECIMHLRRPVIDWEDTMANPMLAIFNKKAFDEDNVQGILVGTGPWKAGDFKASSYFELDANEDYWGEKALAKKFIMKCVTEQTAQAIMFENGELDFAGVANQNLAAYEANPELEVDSYVMTNTQYIGFNMNSPICSDINFRRAVLYAIDRQDYNDITLQGYGHTWDTGSYWGSRTDYKKDIPVIERDVEKAKEFLAQSSYVPGTPVKIIAAMSMTISNAQVLQQQLADVGITIDIFDTDNATLGATTGWGSTSYDMIANSGPWTKLASSCEMFFRTQSTGNKAQYSNPEVDELLAKAAMTPNGPEREALYYQIQDIVAEDIPYIGIFNMQMFVGRHANCGGVILWPDNYNDYSHAYKIIEE